MAPSAGRLSGPAPGLRAGVAAAHRAERAGDFKFVEPAYHEPASLVIRRELRADDMRASGAAWDVWAGARADRLRPGHGGSVSVTA